MGMELDLSQSGLDKTSLVKLLTEAIRAYDSFSTPIELTAIGINFLNNTLSPTAFYDAAVAAGFSPTQIREFGVRVATGVIHP